MDINLLVFGQIADIAGQPEFRISGIMNTEGLKKKLVEQYPALRAIKYSIAVNRNIVQVNTRLKQDDTVALLPPFSGG